MKKFLLLLSVAMLSLTAVAQNTPVFETPRKACGAPKKVTMPVYTDELIDEAPAGTVVSDCQRSCFSYYYSGGTVLGGYNDGFVGEYVIGDDGCIYLKNVCASLPLNTYLKLEKVDEENYVAHTAQLIWVDNSGDSPYLAFATRLVFHNYGEGYYGYTLEEDEDGKALTDVYFTFKDGVLQQKDQEVLDLNGQTLPHELIAFTNSSGGWIGYGDACITIRPVGNTPTVLPEGAEVKQASFSFNSMSSSIGENVRYAYLTQYAEVGNDYYLLSPLDHKNWLKGTIDRDAQTVSFKKQYAGINEEIGCHEWMVPATYNTWKDVWDEEDDYGEWVRDYTAVDAYVCKYDNGNIISEIDGNKAIVFSLSDTEMQRSGVYADFSVKAYEDKLAKPATPRILRFSPVEDTFFFGELIWGMPNVDENDVYINTDELSYVIYFNSDSTPFTFNTEDHWSLEENMSEFPYHFTDDSDFFNNGGTCFHNIYFYELGVTYAGVQAIHRKDGQEMRSEIGWINHDPDGIANLINTISADGKFLNDNKIIIVKNGRQYDLQGKLIK